jgi:hypothetical protein
MALHRDYLLRLIQKMAEAIARALGAARSGKPEEGVKALENAVASDLGMPLPMLLKLTPHTILSLLGPEKARMLVDALRAYAEMTALARREAESQQASATANALDGLLRR